MTREVYGQCAQYDNKEDMFDAIKKAAKKVTSDYLKTLHRYIPKRAMKVIEARGCNIKH